MGKTRPYISNFTKGEVSEYIGARPDLQSYYNALRTGKNIIVLPEGGAQRRAGTRKVAEVKDSSKATILVPFSRSRSLAYIVEVGDDYMRFYKDTAQILSSGNPYEIASPYQEADLPFLQWQQSVDVMMIGHPDYAPRRLSNFADTNWTLPTQPLEPPPTVEDEPTGTDLGGGTLTPAATTGTGINFHSSFATTFLAGDEGRRIVSGVGEAVIVTVTDGDDAVCDIITDFASTSAIPAADWRLTLSPQVQLDPNKIKPIGGPITIAVTGGTATFRTTDVNKYIRMDGGLVEITERSSASQVKGIIKVKLSDADDAGATAMAPAGSWSLEVPAWDNTAGWPRAIDFHQGRLLHAGSYDQPTTFWGSASDSFENFGVGSLAADAYQYTLRNRKANPITWIASNGELFLADEGGVQMAKGAGTDEPLGGNVIPFIKPVSTKGGAPIQPVNIDGIILYVHASRAEFCQLMYNLERDRVVANNVNILARHLADALEGGSPIKQGAIAFAEKPNSVIYICREDGALLALTYYDQEQVVAWTRLITDGAFESVAVISHPDGNRDQVWTIVRRTVNGATKRFVEVFEDAHASLSNRTHDGLVTDCATVQTIGAVTIDQLTGLDYLEAKSVDVLWNKTDGTPRAARYLGQFTVTAGVVYLGEDFTGPGSFEIGLRYTPELTPLRPAIPGSNVEGIPRKWSKIFARLKETQGLTINGREVNFDVGDQAMDEGPALFTGDKEVSGQGWDTDGYLTFSQSYPAPMTILGIFGDLELGGR